MGERRLTLRSTGRDMDKVPEVKRRQRAGQPTGGDVPHNGAPLSLGRLGARSVEWFTCPRRGRSSALGTYQFC
jgi:hypothetical protein